MAFGKRKEAAPQLSSDGYDKALDWEASRSVMIEKSNTRAWGYVKILGALLVLSWAGMVLMLPLKETIPYVIRVDSATGVPDIVTAMNQKGVGYDEVMDKYWIARYVRARESYDWYTLQADYDATGMMSAPGVAKEYAAQFNGESAIQTKLGNGTRIKTEVLSVVPTGAGIATVRFQRRRGSPDGTQSEEVTSWIATIAYEYRNPSVMKESYRLINPLGFQVTSYRVDPELGGGSR